MSSNLTPETLVKLEMIWMPTSISTYHPEARSTYIVIAYTGRVNSPEQSCRGWGLVASTRHTVNQFDDSDDSSAGWREGCLYERIRNQNLIMRVKRDVPWSQRRVTESRLFLILWVIFFVLVLVGSKTFNDTHQLWRELQTLNSLMIRAVPANPKPDQLQCISCGNYHPR